MRDGTWYALVEAALLGTERAELGSPGAAPRAVAPYRAALDPTERERALLGAAALLAAYRAAGRLPQATEAPPVAPGSPDEDDAPVAPPGVSRFLSTMLAGVYVEVLPEWLARVGERGWRVPPMVLPALLEVGTRSAALRERVPAVLGARGRWLAAQRDDWRWAASVGDSLDERSVADVWETGSPDQRRELLARVRRTDPRRGLELLASTWDDDAPAQRAMLLGALRTQLGLDDEPFLERALDDRRQEVRSAAAALLAELPESALVRRMTERARAALRYVPGTLLRGGHLVAEPPAELDPALARDGVDKRPPAGMGERAWWLAQLLAAVPPATWTADGSAEPNALIRLAAESDWAHAIFDGWAAAAMRFRDARWAEALLAHRPRAEARGAPTRLAPSRTALLTVLPPSARETLVAATLRRGGDDGAAAELLVGLMHEWSEAFARRVLDWLRERAADDTSADAMLRAALPRLALHVPPSLHADAARGWPTDDAARAWGAPVERFRSVLSFRHAIAQELAR